jgi:hypothetical protein
MNDDELQRRRHRFSILTSRPSRAQSAQLINHFLFLLVQRRRRPTTWCSSSYKNQPALGVRASLIVSHLESGWGELLWKAPDVIYIWGEGRHLLEINFVRSRCSSALPIWVVGASITCYILVDGSWWTFQRMNIPMARALTKFNWICRICKCSIRHHRKMYNQSLIILHWSFRSYSALISVVIQELPDSFFYFRWNFCNNCNVSCFWA